MEITRSEDCLIFNGLTPKLTKMDRVYEAISEFMKKKLQTDLSDRFNFIAFQELGPSYLDQFSLDAELVINELKSVEKHLVPANLAGGIFVAVTFIIDVFKKISEKTFRLILLADEGSREIPLHFLPVLENLIEKVVDMPFYIDVIQVGDVEYQEVMKLKNLVRKTYGEYYPIENVNDLSSVLIQLSEKKNIEVAAYHDKKKQKIIHAENRPFYINLADDPIKYLEDATCAICFQKGDAGLVQCPSCESIAHSSCWARWAKISNIGIFHVFRCHNCFNILKFDAKFVQAIHEGRDPTKEELKRLRRQTMINYIREQEAKDRPKIVQVSDPLAFEPQEVTDTGEHNDSAPDVDESVLIDDSSLNTQASDDKPSIIDIPPQSPIIVSNDDPFLVKDVPNEPMVQEESVPINVSNTPSSRGLVDMDVIDALMSDLQRDLNSPRPSKDHDTKPDEIKRIEDQKIIIFMCPNCSEISRSTKRKCPICGFENF